MTLIWNQLLQNCAIESKTIMQCKHPLRNAFQNTSMCFCALDAVSPLEMMSSVSQRRSNQLGRQNAAVQTQWHNLSVSGPAHQSNLSTTTIHHAALLSHGGILPRDWAACHGTTRLYVTHMFLQSQVRIFMSFGIITKQHWCRTKA